MESIQRQRKNGKIQSKTHDRNSRKEAGDQNIVSKAASQVSEVVKQIVEVGSSAVKSDTETSRVGKS